jgi:predicted Ser/Thr protein kinase
MALRKGRILENRYRIAALLGQGGMGAVYRATDRRFNTTVAIKENRMATAESQRQFSREAGLLHRLRHPNLPRVTDYFSIPGQGQYLVMDYVEGQDLKEVLARHGPVPEAQALEWIGQVLGALEYLHGEGIIHRDVKPANVKITPRGEIVLVDFGLAKIYDAGQETTVGARGVTPGFAPPEQYGLGRTDARSDIYSVAATLYALLTGHTPPDALQCVTRQAEFVPPRQLNPGISPEVEAAILRAMESAPDARFQKAADLRAALLQTPARPIGVEAVAAPSPGAPVRAPEPEAAPATPTPPPSQPVAEAAGRLPEPPRGVEAHIPDGSAAAGAEPESRPTNWRRVAWLVLLAALMGAVGAQLEANSVREAAGHYGVAVVVLGLLLYYARRPLERDRGQYQTEVFFVWLTVTIAYLGVLSLLDENRYDAWEVPLGTAAMFWIPSALIGTIVLRLAHRRALQKEQ